MSTLKSTLIGLGAVIILLFFVKMIPTIPNKKSAPTTQAPTKPMPWDEPTRKFKIVLTNSPKLDRFTCTEQGGIWVFGESKDFSNVVKGCAFPQDQEQQ